MEEFPVYSENYFFPTLSQYHVKLKEYEFNANDLVSMILNNFLKIDRKIKTDKWELF